MNKRVKLMVVALSALTVLTIGVGATVASAAGPRSTANEQAVCGAGAGFRFGGSVIDEAVTKLLGMTEAEIQALRQEGKSLVQIAATKNKTEKQLVDAIMAYKTAQVQSRVTAGTLTQEQATLMLAQMQQNTIEAVNRTSAGPFGGQGNGQCGTCLTAQNQPQTGPGQSSDGTGPGGMNRCWGRGSR